MSRYTAVLDKSLGTGQQHLVEYDRDAHHTVGARLARTEEPKQHLGHHANVFTGLIARLFVGGGTGGKLQVVAFTSALPREGVSYTARRASEELRHAAGMRVAVVSAADLLSTEVESVASAILGTPHPGARLYSDSPRRSEAEVERRLEALRAAHDVVLVDAGSVTGDGWIVRLGAKVDGTVVVVESGRTRKSDVTAAAGTVAAAGGKVVGLILNRRRTLIPAWLERLIG